MKNYPKINVGVGGLIIRGKSEVLLVKRKSDLSTWTISSGYMEKNENLFETIIREAKEEANIVIKPKGIIGIRQRLTEKEGNNLWLIVMADYISGKVMPDNSEIFQTKFITFPKALKEKITPITKQLIQLLLNNQIQIFLPQNKFNQKNYKFFS